MKKGVTLIEVLVTALILVISITGVLMSLVTASSLVRESIHKANASEIINQSFEGLQRRTDETDVYQYLSNHIVGGVETFEADSVTRNLKKDLNWTYFIEYQVYDVPGSDLKGVIARVSWDLDYTQSDSRSSLYMQMFTNNPD